ncbi:putative transferase, protein kinase RLK-Pelle-LRR-XI-2 family [Helianthus annuus]|uniref:Transferase, protein kinase RLK-Pelle-LRR-XI-2 family n=1 Tax=Helianthus annuus TaxID=4232 RepID=A0A251TZJ0_HELAN|nr:leucine-rich repeat receptor-like serine/threonine/tyrosine-protein kinase SOBIR1 [Helianthus annuus]KAF5792903.1 putative transferase, protein kinase RLK-Pelle-LRR-XI-2 family [Helianthus annuus]KAJ0527798.1 putative transferase, protein kinase RLK-Pelle-LRR-XI-2 family [Helianthus annuus]KAJ0544221.1 putative transferase, protein kinase RLK-Pelle-LRR-XI-2 family [Helianthus annuus]
MATVRHLSLLTFITLILSVQSTLILEPTDHKALLTLHKALGISTNSTSICNTTGIFCERRISNTTTVLKVTRIVLNHRRLRGSISPAIGKLSELKELILSNNHLVNQIPVQISSCRKLEVLDVKNNRFSGSVPVQLSSLNRLRILDLSSNKFSGDLNFLKYFPNLEKLSLANNMFTGKIPVSIRSFRNLRFFNISGNSFLEGPVPTINKLENVPKRYSFAESESPSNSSISNSNSSTSSDDVMAPSPAPASAPIHKNKNKKKKVIRWILGFAAGTVAGLICGSIVSVLFKIVLNMIKGKKSDSGTAIFSQLIKAEELAFLEDDDAVASLQIIGKGGCGEVYKTELPSSKVKTIAIKKIVQPPKDAAELTEEDTKLLNKKMRQIKSEIQTVGQIRHRNLVPLLAHVSRPNCHYLVYEFMKNGSLQDILQQVKDGNRELDWLARHRIALGIAAGLEYLHLSHTPRIVHRDLKPANVLLDDDMEARIADFGLAKSIPDADTHMTSSNVAGTLGYIAPEYHQTLKFTDKCDIYSFGVVLAVLVMGKLPSDGFFQTTNEMNMVKWLRNVMTGEDPKQAIDPQLLGNGYEEQMLLVLKVACFCTLDNPKERPNSKDARLMLAQIIH